MKELYKIEISSTKNKKYSLYVLDNNKPKKIHFGNKDFKHYRDTTPLMAYTYLNHYDNERRIIYLKRAKAIKKKGEYSWINVNSPNYYSVKYLWGG